MNRLEMVLAALLASGALHAQSARAPALPAGMQDPQVMMKAMEAAEAGARQPGDESLTCDQLQTQLTAAMQDPAYQAYLQAAAANAQQDMAASKISKAEIAAKTSAAAAASMVPGASAAQLAAGMAENQAKVAQGQARLQSRMGQAQDLAKLMPLLMRAQRLAELGLAKRCEWAAAAATGMAAPDGIRTPNR